MGKRGINPKTWFYGFQGQLAGHGDHARRVLSGCASEQWLNAELFAHVSSRLGRGMYAYPEDQKRDLSVFAFRDGEEICEAVLETKLVYANYPDTRVDAYTKRLCDQVRSAARAVAKEQPGYPCLAVGLIVGVWQKWRPEEYFPQRRARPDFGSFRRNAGAIVRERSPREPSCGQAHDGDHRGSGAHRER